MASIQGVYVALFGRPADPTGLAFFNTATNNGADLSAIGDLSATQEYKDRFAGQNNVQIVSSIYQSLFNRAPEAEGLNFFVNALNTGSLSINNIAIAILDGAQGSDKTIVDAKIASANTFTSRLDTAVEVGNYVGNAAAAQGRAFLADVSTTPKTAAQADTAITGLSIGNTGIVLAAAGDVVSLTSTVSTLKSTNSDDTIAAGANLGAANNIDAGLGNDTLNASVSAAVVPGSITSVENFFIASTNDLAAVNFDKVVGEQAVWNNASANDLAITNLDIGTVLGLQGIVAGDTSFGFRAASVTGSSDTVTLNLKGATVTGNVTIADIETLNIVTSGTAVAGVGTIGGSTLKDVKITGDIGGIFNILADATLKSVDASGLNGSGATISIAAASKGVTVTGSKFADIINLSTDATAENPDKDVVVYNAGNISTATQKDTINNFTAGEDKLDLKAFSLTGGKAAVTAFGADPVEGASFLGNALAVRGGTVFADTNNDGVYNAATDFQINLAGGIAVTDVIFA